MVVAIIETRIPGQHLSPRISSCLYILCHGVLYKLNRQVGLCSLRDTTLLTHRVVMECGLRGHYLVVCVLHYLVNILRYVRLYSVYFFWSSPYLYAFLQFRVSWLPLWAHVLYRSYVRGVARFGVISRVFDAYVVGLWRVCGAWVRFGSDKVILALLRHTS